MQITDQLTNLKRVHDTVTVLVALAAHQGGTAKRPLEQGPLRSRAERPSGGVRPARGLSAPSGRVRLARGLRILGRGPPRSRVPPRARRSRSCSRVRAFNALTPQDARHDSNTHGNHAPVLFHRPPGGGHPRHYAAL
jgi:hypothetical protein